MERVIRRGHRATQGSTWAACYPLRILDRMTKHREFLPRELAEALESFHAEGFCVVTGVLSNAQCAALQGILVETQSRADRGEGEERWFADETAWQFDASLRRIVRKVPKPFDTHPVFREIFSSDPVLDLVEAFVGPQIYIHSSKMLYKPARVGLAKPMHQDLAYWQDMLAQQVTLWCAIDAVTADNGCMELVPGAHRKGLRPHVQLEDWQIDPVDVPERPLVVEMAAGDVLFLHPLVPHASRPNRSDGGRLAAIVNYYSEPSLPGCGASYGSETPLRCRAQN